MDSIPPKTLLQLEKLERRIAKQRHETIAVIHKEKGHHLILKTGRLGSVSIDTIERFQLKGNILTHNHPSATCFSEADLLTTIVTELLEIRAVAQLNNQQVLYRARFTQVPDGLTTSQRDAALRTAYLYAHQKAIKELAPEILALPNQTRPTMEHLRKESETVIKHLIEHLQNNYQITLDYQKEIK